MAFKFSKAPRSRAVLDSSEGSIQSALIKELRLTLPANAFVFAVPNGGKRNGREMNNMKRQGLTPGVPDLILIHGGRAFGLELKSKDGKLEDSQREVFPKLREAGMRIEVARSHGEAIQHIREMGIPLKSIPDRDLTQEIKQVFAEANRRRA